MSITTHLYPLAFFDFFTVLAVTAVALLPAICIRTRKFSFIAFLYLFAIFLLYYPGWYGSALLYLLAITFFCLLMFHDKYPFYTVYMNHGICVSVAACIYFKLLPGIICSESLRYIWKNSQQAERRKFRYYNAKAC